MINHILVLAIATALPFSDLCAQAGPSARTSLLEADRAAAAAVFQHGLQTGLQDALADDAILLFEGAPLLAGRGRILQVFGSQLNLARLRIQRMPVFVALSQDGNYGATTGASLITRMGQPPDSGASFGHYIAVWRRAGEAAPWRIVALLENGLMGDATFQRPGAFETGPVPLISGTPRLLVDADLAFAKMAADSGVHAAFGNYAAPDATTPPGETPVTVGADAIRTRMATPARMESVWVWHPVYAGATGAGDFGFTVGESTIRSSRAADASVYEGKYLTVWQQQPDGSIKFILDSGNSR
jgi:ketosteroid isomerase-like protein